MDALKVPLYHSIRKYSESSPIPFHMPGHKLGKGFPEGFLQHIYRMDLTEIPGTDNLHYPEGAIKEAQDLAAQAFGADETFFLVNGSTVGIHAMIMALCRPGDTLIVARDCHQSVIHGMMMAGVTPVYLKPEYEPYYGISGAIDPEDVREALERHPEAVGVLMTRPNYYGICSDIEAIAKIVHAHGRILAVDEAHGAHLKFHKQLPGCAMDLGADICVQSAHKTLPAFTQGAYLHTKGGRIDTEKLRFCLRMLQTTSPSYMIMASLDVARALMEDQGNELLGQVLDHIEWFAQQSGLPLLIQDKLKGGRLDPTRLVICLREFAITGFQMEQILREKYNIQVEMSDLYNIVCIASVADGRNVFEKLHWGIVEGINKFNRRDGFADIYIKELHIPVQGIDLKEILNAKGRRQRLDLAVGRISKGSITPYPPGIPVLCPGEVITKELVDYIGIVLRSGGRVNGVFDGREIDVIE